MKKSLLLISSLLAAGTLSAYAEDITLLNVDFTALSAVPTDWSLGHYQNYANVSVTSGTGLVAPGWGQAYAYASLDNGGINLDADGATYKISYKFDIAKAIGAGTPNFAAVFGLASDDYSLALGNNYNAPYNICDSDSNLFTGTAFVAAGGAGNTIQQTVVSDIFTSAVTTYTVSATLVTSLANNDVLTVTISDGTADGTTTKSYSFAGTGSLDLAGFFLDGPGNSTVVVENLAISKTMDESSVSATISGDSTWTTDLLADQKWTNSSETVHSVATITTDVAATLEVGSGVATSGVTVSGSNALTLTGEELAIYNCGDITVESGATLNVQNNLKFIFGGSITCEGTGDSVGKVDISQSTITVVGGSLSTTLAIANSAKEIKLESAGTLNVGLIDSGSSITKATGTGTIELSLNTTTWDNTFTIGNNDFTGTVKVAAGHFTLASSYGKASTLELSGTAGFQVTSAGQEFSQNLAFVGGAHDFHVNQDKSLELKGELSITSLSSATKQGAGTLTISGDVAVTGTLGVNVGTMDLTSTGTVSIGTLKVSGGTLNAQSSTAQISNLNVTGGTANVNAGSVTTATLTGGITNVQASSVTLGTFNVQSAGALEFKKVDGATSTSYTLTELAFNGDATCTGTVTIDKDVTVNATRLTNNWGFSELEVNGTLNLTGTGSGSFNLSSGSANTITGSGRINVAGTFTAGNTGSYVLDGGIKLYAKATSITQPVQLKNATLGNTTENWTIPNSNQISIGNATFDAAENTTITLTNAMAGIADTAQTLTKIGVGELVLDGKNTYTGTTSIQGGTLRISATGGVSGDVEIKGGRLRLGAGSVANVSLSGLKIVLDSLGEDSAIYGNASSTLTITGNDGKIELALDIVSHAALDQLTYQIVDSGMTTLISSLSPESFTLDASLAGYRVSDWTGGVVTLTAIPEPSMFGLLAGTLALALAGTRRRRRGNAK